MGYYASIKMIFKINNTGKGERYMNEWEENML